MSENRSNNSNGMLTCVLLLFSSDFCLAFFESSLNWLSSNSCSHYLHMSAVLSAVQLSDIYCSLYALRNWH